MSGTDEKRGSVWRTRKVYSLWSLLFSFSYFSFFSEFVEHGICMTVVRRDMYHSSIIPYFFLVVLVFLCTVL